MSLAMPYKPFVAVLGPYLGVVMCAAHAVTGHTSERVAHLSSATNAGDLVGMTVCDSTG